MLTHVLSLLALLAIPLAASTAQAGPRPAVIHDLKDLSQYVGTYPCRNGLLKSRVLLGALQNALRDDYAAYRAHMGIAGCGAIVRVGAYVVLDVSQLHVGGYSSLILVRPADGALFVYWLKSAVVERQGHIYGPRPVPSDVASIVEHAMNVEWGHVACFTGSGDSVAIDTARRANQDTGQCMSM